MTRDFAADLAACMEEPLDCWEPIKDYYDSIVVQRGESEACRLFAEELLQLRQSRNEQALAALGLIRRIHAYCLKRSRHRTDAAVYFAFELMWMIKEVYGKTVK